MTKLPDTLYCPYCGCGAYLPPEEWKVEKNERGFVYKPGYLPGELGEMRKESNDGSL